VTVSVVVVTHDHAAFIERALESVLMQEIGEDCEVLVSEDRSSDGTRVIVERWHARHPGRIRLLLSDTNLRSNAVVARGFRAARGRYVALLDGDDYWTSPRKLATQAAFLDRHPECTVCFHDAEVVDAAGRTTGRRWTPAGQAPRATLADLWGGNFIATCSAMFRGGVLADIPAWYDDCFPVTDWPLYVLYAEHGDIGYIPEVMGAYRLHAGGLYSSLPDAAKLRSVDRLYRLMDAGTGHRHASDARRGHRRYFLDWTREYLARGDLALARTALRSSVAWGWPRTRADLVETARLGVAAFGPFGRRGAPLASRDV
jgi:glycosyltransferase involved in cell wall biosynthesis